MSAKNPIRVLNAEVARKIAAGEVIDRPNAIVRELMDNAIDSGAQNITVEITGGGIESIRIVDDGCGMTKEDLAACARPHATSKISTETDLLNLSTMGFRGEALASIAAVSRLSVISGGFKMEASITKDHEITPSARIKGTIVQSQGLFENFPARRQFLKRAGTEALMCKNTFVEKALSRPDLAFKLIIDGQIKINLQKVSSLKDRFIDAGNFTEPKELFFQIENACEGTNPEWKFTVIMGEPAVSRNNKKEINIYVNGRKIQEYALVQAVEYGATGYFPNGTFPVACVFIQMDPKLVDFNIHPAKREARFYDISSLHHGLSSSIKNFLLAYTKQNFERNKTTDEVLTPENEFNFKYENNTSYEKHISYIPNKSGEHSFSDYRSRYFSSQSQNEPASFSFGQSRSLAEKALSESDINQEIITQNDENLTIKKNVRYIGKCLGTFLLAEKDSNLFIIDQHAVHERILFDKIMTNQGQRQPLLIPYKINTESKNQDNHLEKLKSKLWEIGFELNKIEDGQWEVTSVPERWKGSEIDLRTLIFVKQIDPDQIIRSIAAMTACKAAVKDGYFLDDITAEELVDKAFTLPDPHCPHGRPVYTVISKEKLFEMVKRT